jgi:hypothetical protein
VHLTFTGHVFTCPAPLAEPFPTPIPAPQALVGLDLSASMLTHARQRASAASPPLKAPTVFIPGDIRDVPAALAQAQGAAQQQIACPELVPGDASRHGAAVPGLGQ